MSCIADCQVLTYKTCTSKQQRVAGVGLDWVAKQKCVWVGVCYVCVLYTYFIYIFQLLQLMLCRLPSLFFVGCPSPAALYVCAVENKYCGVEQNSGIETRFDAAAGQAYLLLYMPRYDDSLTAAFSASLKLTGD